MLSANFWLLDLIYLVYLHLFHIKCVSPLTIVLTENCIYYSNSKYCCLIKMQLLCHSQGARFLLVRRGNTLPEAPRGTAWGHPRRCTMGIYSLLSSLMMMPFVGRRIRSAKGWSSSRFWHASMLKERKMDARITFSSIMAKRWPAHDTKKEQRSKPDFEQTHKHYHDSIMTCGPFHSFPFTGWVILTAECHYKLMSQHQSHHHLRHPPDCVGDCNQSTI